jgi:hypothetical protein
VEVRCFSPTRAAENGQGAINGVWRHGSRKKSESSTMGEGATLSDLLVSSILDLKVKEANHKAGIAVGKKPGYHK